MRTSLFKGLSFGITSGVITTLGLIVGLHSFTGSKEIIIGGIITIAVADSLSDALGVHISEESEKESKWVIWESTLATFISKLIFALTFIIPIIIFSLNAAIWISIIWGLLLIGALSYYIAKGKNDNPKNVVTEHLIITAIVVILTHYLGDAIRTMLV